MSYYKQQRDKALALIQSGFFGSDGGGAFKKVSYPYVLQDARTNLYPAIRDKAIACFAKKGIGFWNATNDGPNGHTLSSQIACINHLFFLYRDQQVATAILAGIDGNVENALAFDDGGYVDFEVNGTTDYLNENNRTRGALTTSVDAVMLAQMKNGTRKLFFIEWKYTESYTNKSLAEGREGQVRLSRYNSLLQASDSPISNIGDFRPLYIEPYYQLMRQTLLAHAMVKAGEYGAADYIHLHVIPTANKELKGKKTSASLSGNDLDSAWKGVLNQPEKYVAIDPETLLAPANLFDEAKGVLEYLQIRYW